MRQTLRLIQLNAFLNTIFTYKLFICQVVYVDRLNMICFTSFNNMASSRPVKLGERWCTNFQ